MNHGVPQVIPVVIQQPFMDAKAVQQLIQGFWTTATAESNFSRSVGAANEKWGWWRPTSAGICRNGMKQGTTLTPVETVIKVLCDLSQKATLYLFHQQRQAAPNPLADVLNDFIVP